VSLEIWVKLRAALQMGVDACQAEIERLEPKPKQFDYDIMQIRTVQVEGQRGFYLQATADNNSGNAHFEALVQDLLDHNNRLNRQGYFCWLFDKTHIDTVGMKLLQK
jgi:hypothetical protein